MGLNYKVQAQVVDIKFDTPKNGDKFLIDTNVLLWTFYPLKNFNSLPANSKLRPKHYQITKYPDYIDKTIEKNSLLFYCGLSMAETAHIIEKYEKEAFSPALPPKEYRHNYPEERNFVVSEIKDFWNEIEIAAESTEILINKISTKDALAKFENVVVDGYDLFIIESMLEAGINQIVTDDGDYITVPGIKVFTANNSMIEAAKLQGKLIRR
jgi:predicted nucleic acid-binding protein